MSTPHAGLSSSVIQSKKIAKNQLLLILIILILLCAAGRPGSSEVPRNPLTRWDVSSIPANGIFLTKKVKNKSKNAQRVEND